MPEIKFQGKVTRYDVGMLVNVELKSKIILLSLLLIFGLVGGLCILTELNENQESILSDPIIILLVLLIIAQFIVDSKVRHFYTHNPVYRGHIHGVINEMDIIINGEDAEARINWDTITQYRQTKDFIVLYHSNNNPVVFPETLFASSQEWEEFVALVKAKLPIAKRIF